MPRPAPQAILTAGRWRAEASQGAVEGRQRVDIQVVGLQRYHPLTVEPTFVNGWSWPSTVDRLLWLGGR